jgi:mycofactocin precursor
MDVGSLGNKRSTMDEKEQQVVTVETLVEDVSIDGMCGVY